MQYQMFVPPVSLRQYVRYFWVLESQGDSPYIHRSMADGCVEMVFHYHGQFDELSTTGIRQKSFNAGIHGPTRSYNRYETPGTFGIFGAYLYPFAVPVLFKQPAIALSNLGVDLETFLGVAGRIVSEQILGSTSTSERIAILTKFLERQLKAEHHEAVPIFSSINMIIRKHGLVSIDALASHACQSTRQLERNFKTFAGFSPKTYTRIIRFQSALQYFGQQDQSLTAIAMACGYYDQAHFIHDFKKFSGHTPKEYFVGHAEGTAWRV